MVRKIFCFPRASQNRKCGFTLVEVLLVSLILTLILAALFITLTTGESVSAISSAKIDLQAQLRQVINWITQDIRRATVGEIANNSPSSNHVKFRQVQGVDTTTGYYILSDNYIEYNYDNNLQKITRSLVNPAGEILQSWQFNNIAQPPFYTRDASGGIVSLNQSDLSNSRKIIVTITCLKTVKGSLNLTSNLSQEVKIRNE
ncbi:MAG: prepilin-type N-terminal cleavage/methylation domain-containing protein [Candidatus Omnitrophica bacterium]|nr:prepilin-type N-terminal cleavage/methylation domain-containing protein [Candidatus Omnitrophota bacterium]